MIVESLINRCGGLVFFGFTIRLLLTILTKITTDRLKDFRYNLNAGMSQGLRKVRTSLSMLCC